jgi:sugar lactone lactonase YvrE
MNRRSFLALTAAWPALGAASSRRVRVETAFRSPCEKPNGLEATEEGLWILNQGADNALYLVDYNGKLIEKLPTDSKAGSGVGFDGKHLWIASTYDCKILKVDRKTGKTLAAHPTPGAGPVNWPNPRQSPLSKAAQPAVRPVAAKRPPSPRPSTGAHGVEFKDGKLWIAVPPSQTIYRIDPDTFRIEHQFRTAGDRPHGLGWEGEHLWCADSNANAFHRYDVRSGEVLEIIQLSDSDPLPHGVDIRNGVVWYCDDVGVVCRFPLRG